MPIQATEPQCSLLYQCVHKSINRVFLSANYNEHSSTFLNTADEQNASEQLQKLKCREPPRLILLK